MMYSILRKLTRKKPEPDGDTDLLRVLNTYELAALGIGSTIGVGFYILTGTVAEIAGPAVTLSFLIAAVTSLFAGLCYSEFGSRVPKAGSAYTYSYICVGEFVAFIIGWNLILEYIIGAASVARGLSGYIDTLAGGAISEALQNAMPIHSSFLGPYPDFLALVLCLCVTGIISVGIKESSVANLVFAGVNILVVIYAIIAAGTKVDGKNWALSEDEIYNGTICPPVNQSEPSHYGSGGFTPFGFSGVMHGAAICFYGFVGFDVIAALSEETHDPGRSIPRAISATLLIVFIAYFGISAVVTLALPYCNKGDAGSLVYVFDELGMEVSRWIIIVGAIFGFSTSLFGAMLPMPRIIYAMGSDGLLFNVLSTINQRFKTPLIATVISGCLAGILAMLFDLQALVSMMSIGTLMAYTIVSLCVILLRYSCSVKDDEGTYSLTVETSSKVSGSDCLVYPSSVYYTKPSSSSSFFWKEYLSKVVLARHLSHPTGYTASFVGYATLVYTVLAFVLTLLLKLLQPQLEKGDVLSIVLVCLVFLLCVANVLLISFNPESDVELAFKVILVPWLPALSALINIYLMCSLSGETWVRFGIWMIVGLLIYFLYGIQHSSVSCSSFGCDYAKLLMQELDFDSEDDPSTAAINEEQSLLLST